MSLSIEGKDTIFFKMKIENNCLNAQRNRNIEGQNYSKNMDYETTRINTNILCQFLYFKRRSLQMPRYIQLGEHFIINACIENFEVPKC